MASIASAFWDALVKLGTALAGGFVSAFNFVDSGLKGLGNALGSWLGAAFQYLASGVTWIGTQLYNFGSWFWNSMQWIGSTLQNGIGWIGVQLNNFGGYLWNGLQWIGTTFLSSMSWLGTQLYNFGQWFWNGIQWLGTTIDDGLSWIGVQLFNVGNWLYNGLKYSVSWFVNILTTVWNSLAGWFGSISTAIGSWWGSVTTGLNNWWLGLVTGFRSKLKTTLLVDLSIAGMWQGASRIFSAGSIKDIEYGLFGMVAAPFVGLMVGEILDVLVPIPSTTTFPLVPPIGGFTHTPAAISIPTPTEPSTPSFSTQPSLPATPSTPTLGTPPSTPSPPSTPAFTTLPSSPSTPTGPAIGSQPFGPYSGISDGYAPIIVSYDFRYDASKDFTTTITVTHDAFYDSNPPLP